jgi:hypothetical protein
MLLLGFSRGSQGGSLISLLISQRTCRQRFFCFAFGYFLYCHHYGAGRTGVKGVIIICLFLRYHITVLVIFPTFLRFLFFFFFSAEFYLYLREAGGAEF